MTWWNAFSSTLAMSFVDKRCCSLQVAMRQVWVRLGFGSVGGHRRLFDLVIRSGAGDFKAFYSSPAYEESMRDWFTAFGQHDTLIMAELSHKISRVDLSDYISRINCQTLIVGGDSDSYIPASHALDFRSSARCGIGAVALSWPHVFRRANAGASGHARSLAESFVVPPRDGIAA